MGNIRDMFSSGGKQKILFNNKEYTLPRVCGYIHSGKDQIKNIIINSNQDDLINRWELSTEKNFNSNNEKISYWIDQATLNLLELLTPKSNFPVKAWLNSLFLEDR